MEIALGVAVAVIAVLAAAIIVMLARRQPRVPESGEAFRLFTERLEDLAGLKARLEGIASVQDNLRSSLTSLETALKGVETRVVESTGSVKESVLRDFADARRTLDGIKGDLDARK